MSFPSDTSKLEDYLRNQGVIEKSTKINSLKQFSQGQSNPTYELTLSTNQRLVLRKKPNGKLLPGAHQIEREYQITRGLSQVGFPVAKPLILCEDSSIVGTPFFVMEFVEGRIFKDIFLDQLQPNERVQVFHEMVRVLAQLHSLDIKKMGLDKLGKPEDFYKRQVNTWSRQYKLAETDRISAMEDLMVWLQKTPQDDTDDVVCFCHGDFAVNNVVFHPTEFKIIAVFDWELATVGRAYADIAYMTQFYHMRGYEQGPVRGGIKRLNPSLFGLPAEKELTSLYMKHRGISKDLDLFYQQVFSMFRLASIAQGVYKRAKQGNASQQSDGLLIGKVAWALADDAWDYVKLRTQNDPFNVRDKLENDLALWSNWNVSDRCKYYYYEVKRFLIKEYFPLEKQILEHLKTEGNAKDRWQPIPEIEQLKAKAKAQGLWNLFCTYPTYGKGLTNLEYAFICELMGMSFWAPEVFNCSAPDTGNMELLMLYANEAQKKKYLEPILNGEIRSCFAMTEPAVASSDATNIQCSITKQGDGYVVRGKKWYISGAGDPRCKVCIVMGKSNPNDPKVYRQQSMIVVELPHPQVKITRPMGVFGFDDAPHGHMEIEFNDAFVPAENLIWEEGKGFEMAQGRLGGGRLHHCMRLVGLGQRLIDLAIQRSETRTIFKQKMKDNQSFQQKLGTLVMMLDSCRLMVLNASSLLDQFGNKRSQALKALSEAKAYVPQVICDIADAVLQFFGGEGFSQDQIIAYSYVQARTLRVADGPDEVHLRQIAKFAVHQHYKSEFPKKQGYGIIKL